KASGKVALRRGVSDSTTLLGFYHSEDSLAVNPSQSSGFPRCFLGVAVEGPSREGFFLYPAYRVRGDGQGYATGPSRPHILPDGRCLRDSRTPRRSRSTGPRAAPPPGPAGSSSAGRRTPASAGPSTPGCPPTRCGRTPAGPRGRPNCPPSPRG